MTAALLLLLLLLLLLRKGVELAGPRGQVDSSSGVEAADGREAGRWASSRRVVAVVAERSGGRGQRAAAAALR